MAQSRDVIIVIVDISGYTRFMVAHRKAQAHAEMIVGALLEALMGEVGECLEIAELEGDAIFMYAFKDALESSTQRAVVIGQHLSAFFRVFSAAVADLGANAICKCPACANIGALRIKMVVHSGRVVISQLGPARLTQSKRTQRPLPVLQALTLAPFCFTMGTTAVRLNRVGQG